MQTYVHITLVVVLRPCSAVLFIAVELLQEHKTISLPAYLVKHA